MITGAEGNMTRVCTRCGKPYFVVLGHSCSRRLTLADADVEQAWQALLPELEPAPPRQELLVLADEMLPAPSALGAGCIRITDPTAGRHARPGRRGWRYWLAPSYKSRRARRGRQEWFLSHLAGRLAKLEREQQALASVAAAVARRRS
jgi:hypothetical protein